MMASSASGEGPCQGADWGNRLRSLSLSIARLPLLRVLSPHVGDRLPLYVGDGIGSAAGERHDVALPVAEAGAARQPGRGALVLSLELAHHNTRPMLARRRDARQRQRDDRDQWDESARTRGHWLMLPPVEHDPRTQRRRNRCAPEGANPHHRWRPVPILRPRSHAEGDTGQDPPRAGARAAAAATEAICPTASECGKETAQRALKPAGCVRSKR